MKYIPVVPVNESFKWQIDLFEYSLKKAYGDNYKDYSIIPVLKRNEFTDKETLHYPWKTQLPHKIIDPIFDVIGKEDNDYIPVNVYSGLRQVLKFIPDDEVVMCIDPDMPLLKPYTGRMPEHHEMLVDDIYEGWHMHVKDKNSFVVNPLLKHKDMNYMSGGSNFIGTAKTWKYIIDDIVENAIKIIDTYPVGPYRWWANMYGANVGCHNMRIPMRHIGGCYYPNINQYDEEHWISHYSCDPLFHKGSFPNLKWDEFPDNPFYNLTKEWYAQYSAI